MKTPFYLTAQIGFVILTILYLALFVSVIRKGVNLTSWESTKKKKFISRMILTIILWGVVVSAWSISGKMSDFTMFPFNFMPVFMIPLIIAIIFISFSGTADVLKGIPPGSLLRLQSFRFFVEILLWFLLLDNQLPVQMTFEGRNFDILAGITAPIVAYLAFRGKISRTGIIIWNVIGLCLLFNIVIIAVLSTPTSLRVFMNEPANYIVTWFPVSWLPGFLVPLAYYLHFLSLKQAFIKPVTSRLQQAKP